MMEVDGNGRYIVQIAMCGSDSDPFVVAVCNDGSAWKLLVSERWERLPKIPNESDLARWKAAF